MNNTLEITVKKYFSFVSKIIQAHMRSEITIDGNEMATLTPGPCAK
jgi:hypothetical protein